jgi:hypothetical protein
VSHSRYSVVTISLCRRICGDAQGGGLLSVFFYVAKHIVEEKYSPNGIFPADFIAVLLEFA